VTVFFRLVNKIEMVNPHDSLSSAWQLKISDHRFEWQIRASTNDCYSSSFVWASSSFIHCLAALDFGAGVEQPFGCLGCADRNEVRCRPGHEASLAPHVRTWSLSEANVPYWRKYLWHS